MIKKLKNWYDNLEYEIQVIVFIGMVIMLGIIIGAVFSIFIH